MEGKLFKMVEGYTLSLTGSIDDLYGISNKQLADDHGLHKLSLENCEAIANGYDLDELVNRAFDNMGYHSTVTPHEEKQFKLGYMVAFREVLEILGDKKYTETELYRAFLINSAGNNTTLENTFKETVLPMFIDNEWDVEIEMECGELRQCDCSSNENCLNPQPKLDADGCLILTKNVI